MIDKRELAYLEYCIVRFKEKILTIIGDTQNEIRKKLSRTFMER